MKSFFTYLYFSFAFPSSGFDEHKESTKRLAVSSNFSTSSGFFARRNSVPAAPMTMPNNANPTNSIFNPFCKTGKTILKSVFVIQNASFTGKNRFQLARSLTKSFFLQKP